MNRMKKIFLLLMLLPSLSVLSQTDTSLTRFLNPASVTKSKGYFHSVEIDLGNCKMLVISGQIALDSNGNLIGKNNLEKQADQVFTNIKNIVTASGGTMDHVIRIGIYMTDITQAPAMRKARDQFINLQNPPTSILVQVNKLVRDDLLIEIEATAIIPKKTN